MNNTRELIEQGIIYPVTIGKVLDKTDRDTLHNLWGEPKYILGIAITINGQTMVRIYVKRELFTCSDTIVDFLIEELRAPLRRYLIALAANKYHKLQDWHPDLQGNADLVPHYSML